MAQVSTSSMVITQTQKPSSRTLIPTNDEDGHDARNLLVVAIGRPLEQDNRPPASFGLGGLENQLGVLLEVGVQLQVALRVGGILILRGCGGITHPGQMVLGHLLLRQRVRFGFVGLAKLHLHGLLLVHRLHQGGQPLHIAPVLKGICSFSQPPNRLT